MSDYSYGNLSEPEDALDRSSSARVIIPSNISQGDHSAGSRRLGQQASSRTPSPSGTDRTSKSWSSIAHSSSRLSTSSSGSGIVPYPSTRSFLGVTPGFSAPPEASDLESWASSSQYDSIHNQFASGTPPVSAATTPSRQTSRPRSNSSGSSETTGSHEGESSGQPNHNDNQSLGTQQSDAWSQADDRFLLTEGEEETQVTVIPDGGEAMLGLVLPAPDPFYAESLSDTDSNSELLDQAVDIFQSIENLQNQFADEQTLGDLGPWTPGTYDFHSNREDGILAPAAGRVFDRYYSKAGVYKQRHDTKVREKKKKWKAILANREPVSTSSEYSFVGEETSTYGSDTSSYVGITWRSGQIADDQNNLVECSKICRALDCSKFSVETLSSVFYPPSFYSHLTRSSLATFSAQIAPHGLDCKTDHAIDVSLGFGPTIEYIVCGFIPRRKEDLRSHRKLCSKLVGTDSLPVAVDLFDVVFHAADIDAWLDDIIKSPPLFEEYVALMHRKRKDDPSVQVMECIVKWYLAYKNDLSDPASNTSRAALKLLMTTTLLTSVPRVKHIPESLTRYLLPRTDYSPLQPKLLTRQIKASIHYLQRDLLHALFCYLACNLHLCAQVKAAIALLVAFVLELAQRAGRQFAKYASQIHQHLDVKPQDVKNYETNMQTQVFDRLRASISGVSAELGYLGDMLRGLGSLMTGESVKGQETEEDNGKFVAVILKDVLP